MKQLALVVIVFMFVSCNKQTLPQKSAIDLNSVPVRAENLKEKPVEEAPISELEEKLIEVSATVPDDDDYFVIIGSFRNKDNAMNYQEQIAGKGFSSVLLKNEEGLYRVSVKSFFVIEKAREEIRRIREKFPEHSDTWLLIRQK